MTSTTTLEPTVHRSGPGKASPIQVLPVEDDPDAAALATTQLNQYEDDIFGVEWKSNIVSALNRLAKPGVDVVLLDLGMHEVSGNETHRAITSVVGKTIPVVILTADESAFSQEITRTQGASRYLVKQRTSSVELRQSKIGSSSLLAKSTVLQRGSSVAPGSA